MVRPVDENADADADFVRRSLRRMSMFKATGQRCGFLQSTTCTTVLTTEIPIATNVLSGE